MRPDAEDWKDEAYKTYLARWQAEEAEESERRRQQGKITIWLERGPGDPETFTREHQAELGEVLRAFRSEGVEVDAPFMTMDSPDAGGGYTGEFIVALAAIAAVAKPFATIISAWVKAKTGRKARVEFFPDGSPKRIEATSDDEVISIFEAVQSETKRKPTKKAK
jgi:hypothetical protein